MQGKRAGLSSGPTSVPELLRNHCYNVHSALITESMPTDKLTFPGMTGSLSGAAMGGCIPHTMPATCGRPPHLLCQGFLPRCRRPRAGDLQHCHRQKQSNMSGSLLSLQASLEVRKHCCRAGPAPPQRMRPLQGWDRDTIITFSNASFSGVHCLAKRLGYARG